VPAANSSGDYLNPDGRRLGRCQYCGHCERFVCEAHAKATPDHLLYPVLRARPNFELRTRAQVLHVDYDRSTRRALGVRYLDLETGEEYQQPADVVVLAAFTMTNTRLLLLGGIGEICKAMGADPGSSVVSPHLQHWSADNLFVVGASVYPHNSGYNPTGPLAALALRLGDDLLRYISRPTRL
jgi:choline dehydrogenase-like flavoprotein